MGRHAFAQREPDLSLVCEARANRHKELITLILFSSTNSLVGKSDFFTNTNYKLLDIV